MSAETRLDDLLRRWEELHARGESPTPEDVCRDAPDLLVPFRHELAALRAADAVLGRTSPPPVPGPLAFETSGGRDGPGGGLEIPLQAGAEPVHGYRLVAPLGQGGFGEVWKAEGPGGFPLALKFVRLGGPVGAAEMRALEVLKGLRHPNLLSTVGAWQVGPRLIVAMELADRTLGDRLREVRSAGAPGIAGPELLEYFREAAKGIDFLNEARHTIDGRSGVRLQHRDIKPANILLVGNGVKVADFGLVRLLEHTHASHTGALTPAFAAPEFFAGRTTPHSDQYSLAVSYCQLRGGRLPFAGAPAELMHGHLELPPDLTMLPAAERPAVARALAKKPDERWPDCRSLVGALTEAMSQTPVPTPPPTPSPLRRNPWRGWLVAATLAAVGVAAFAWRGAPPDPSAPPRPIVVGPKDVQPPSVSPEKLDAGVPLPKLVRFSGHRTAVRCIGWHPTEDRVISGDDEGNLWSWDPRSGQPARRLAGHRGAVDGLAISPDGRYLLTGGSDRTVRLWDLRDGREVWNQAAHESEVNCVAISPDGRRGISAGRDLTIRLWDLPTGKELTRFDTDVEYWSVAFTPDGQDVLAAGDSSTILRLPLEANRPPAPFAAHRDVIWSVACASKGPWVVSGGGDAKANQDYQVRVWNLTDGTAASVLDGHTGAVGAVAITSDGRRILSGAADKTLRLWDRRTGREIQRLGEHRAHVTCVTFAPDGTRAASGDLDGSASAWAMTPLVK